MEFGVTEADDGWHVPTTDHPFWTETLWLRFAVPERSLTGILYPIFRPNQRVGSLSVYLWDHEESVERDALYVHRMFHLPLPHDLRNTELLDVFSYQCITPLERYQVHYDDGVELRVNLRYEGVHPPVGREPDGAATSYFQPCHVSGSLEFNGDVIDVDGYELRGSAWGVRPDFRPPPHPDDPTKVVGHADTYAVSGETTFFMGSAGDLATTNAHSGFHMREGEVARIVDGQRMVTRTSSGVPDTIEVHATDALGRHLHAVGTYVNHMYMPMPSYVLWSNGVQWTIDGEALWGGDDDVPGGRPARHLRALAQ
jgi:hypothetical protein